MAWANKEDKAAYQKKWRAENKEAITKYNKIYRAENKERVAAQKKEYYEKTKPTPVKRIEVSNPSYQLLYQRANKDKFADYKSRRKASKSGNGVFIISNKFMKNLYNSPCRFCGASEVIEADHIIPIIKGGRHSEGNLQPLCMPCNRSKNSKLQIEFIAQKKG